MGLTRRDVWYAEFPCTDDGVACRYDKLYGKLTRFTTRTKDRKLAEQIEAQIFSRLLAGTMPSKRAHRMPLTFSSWADTYLGLEEVKALRSTARAYEVATLRKFFQNKDIRAITVEDVRAFRAWRSEQGVSVQTVNHEHAALVHMLNVAVGFGVLDKNVASLVKKPNPNNERDRIMTAEEWARIQQHSPASLIRFLTISYDLGVRLGELLALEWADVDLARREFTLRKTKNGEPRVAPMTDSVYRIFTELDAQRGQRGQDGPDSPNSPDGPEGRRVFGEWACAAALRSAFKSACRKAGIRYGRNGGLTIHDLRHTAVTNLRRAGVDTMTAMRIVGHKSEKMHRRYNTITPDDLHRAVALLQRARHDNPTDNPTDSLADSPTSSQADSLAGLAFEPKPCQQRGDAESCAPLYAGPCCP